MSDDVIELNPDAGKYAYLESGGDYGPGLEFEADVEVVDYQFPAVEAPRYIKGADAKDFAFLVFRVSRAGKPPIRLWHHEPIGSFSGSKLPRYLVNLGVPVEDPTGKCRHLREEVIGRKCGVKVTDPRPDNSGGWWNGRVVDVYGV